MYNLIKVAANKELLNFTSPLTKAINKICQQFVIKPFKASQFNQSNHSVSLGTDSSLANHNQHLFLSPRQ